MGKFSHCPRWGWGNFSPSKMSHFQLGNLGNYRTTLCQQLQSDQNLCLKRILFIRIIRLKSEKSKNYLSIMFRLKSCCCTFKSYFPWYSHICVKVKNHLRIFSGWEFEKLRITLRLTWKILILIKKIACIEGWLPLSSS